MSNEVYGYIESAVVSDWAKTFSKIEDKTGIGIKLIPKSELYNFPENVLPGETVESAAFIIGDSPGKANATYLADYQDYAPDAEIGFPVSGKERLALLINMIMVTIEETKSSRFVVAITDSSQVDDVKKVDVSGFENMVVRDFEGFAPPDCVYDIRVE